MNIAIDVSPLESKHKNRGTGIYTRLLVEALSAFENRHTYTFIHRGEKMPENTDLIHYPYFDPFFLTLPLVQSKPVVVTVHDLIPLVFPDRFPKGLRGNIKWQIQKKSLQNARRIITDSESSKKDIHTIVGFKEDAVDIVPLAPSASFHQIKDKSKLKSIRQKYQLPERYLLYVGDVNWNKNVHGFLEAFASFIHGYDAKDISLVLVGNVFHNTAVAEVSEINRLIDVLNIQKRIIRPGFVSDDELAGIYNQAVCLVQPSHYEGFGLPVLESMASGCPVVCSDVSSLKEIAGPAFRVDPDNIEDISSSIHQIFELSQKKRSQLIQKGIIWAAKFSWKNVAHETVAAYGRALL